MLKRWRLHCLPSHLTPAAPFDSFTAAPILLKSLLSAVVGYLTAFLLNYLVQWDIFQLKLVWKIQQAPECAHIRFGRTVRVPHWLWWEAPSANSMWWNYTWNFCVTQNNWSSRRGEKAQASPVTTRQGGRKGRGNHSQQLCTRNPFPLPRDDPVAALFTFLLLNFKSARRAHKFCLPSKEPALSETPELISMFLQF